MTANESQSKTARQSALRAAPAHATGILTIDVGQIAANWRALAELVAPAECAAVVKADAYGLGAGHVIPALAKAGCKTFFVATLVEAIEARALAPAASVYMLDGILPGAATDIRAAGVTPVVSTLAEIEAWSSLSTARNDRLPTALHVDTGLNRLGLSAIDIQALVRDMHRLDRLNVNLVMSHLACADEPGAIKNMQQRDVFEQLAPLLPSTRRSLAASDGLMLGKPFHFDLVRPGYALYGGQAFGGGSTPVAPTVELHVKILQMRDVVPGQTVGYSATWTPSAASRIAIIAAGYADGLFRHLSRETGGGGGVVAINGQLAPIVGRVSMDLVTVDVTGIDNPAPQVGDLVEVIGPTLPIEQLGAAAGTIGYEVLTSLGRRFHRVHFGLEA